MQNALDLDIIDHYVLSHKLIIWATPTLLERKQLQSATSPNNFTAQEARNYSNAELPKICNRVVFAKHSNTTLKLLGKAIPFDFSLVCENHLTEFYPNARKKIIAYNVLGVGLRDYI